MGPGAGCPALFPACASCPPPPRRKAGARGHPAALGSAAGPGPRGSAGRDAALGRTVRRRRGSRVPRRAQPGGASRSSPARGPGVGGEPGSGCLLVSLLAVSSPEGSLPPPSPSLFFLRLPGRQNGVFGLPVPLCSSARLGVPSRGSVTGPHVLV